LRSAARLREADQSDVVTKGLDDLRLTNPRLSPPLRALLSLPVPRKVKSVLFTVPTTEQGKVLFNLVRHALELRALDEAAVVIDLQRLQMASQLIAMVCPVALLAPSSLQIEPWPAHRRLLEQHGVALLLFPPLLARLFEQTNRSHGRASPASIRNCLARVHFVTTALCRWFKCARPTPVTAIFPLLPVWPSVCARR
jgi:hypothetical protein